jgi:hypothetical protein
MVRADLGPHLPDADWPAAHGGRQTSIKRVITGIYYTPVSPRDHPEFLADYKAVRARTERKNGVLRQFTSVTRARVWRAIAALHAYLAVVTAFVIALTNMERRTCMASRSDWTRKRSMPWSAWWLATPSIGLGSVNAPPPRRRSA